MVGSTSAVTHLRNFLDFNFFDLITIPYSQYQDPKLVTSWSPCQKLSTDMPVIFSDWDWQFSSYSHKHITMTALQTDSGSSKLLYFIETRLRSSTNFWRSPPVPLRLHHPHPKESSAALMYRGWLVPGQLACQWLGPVPVGSGERPKCFARILALLQPLHWWDNSNLQKNSQLHLI
jgi:hypothetical protein